MDNREQYRCLVDGQLVSGKLMPIVNPATAEVFAFSHVADESMVDTAVESASRAQARWRKVPLVERRASLQRLADIVRDNGASLAQLLTLEQGKPLADARDEVVRAEALYRHYAESRAEDTDSLFTETKDGHTRTYTPLGVVAGIVPWNFPLVMMAMKVGPALLTGNTIIVKPAPTTPATTLEFARLCAAELPAGLLQALGDGGSVGPLLTAHPGVRCISFTGSTSSGRKVLAAASGTLKRVNLELGGNDPAIVLGDADPEVVAAGIFYGAFRNTGQVCGAIKRVYVHDAIYEAFSKALGKLIESVVVGDGLQPGVTMGPLQNKAQYDKASALLADASRKGMILAQASKPAGEGYFVPPTLFGGLDDLHSLVTEEQFAPLLPLQRFSTEADAITRANATHYGLTASVWSSDVERAEALVQKIDAALLCVNQHNKCTAQTGICMSKDSGWGWTFGDEGIKEFLQPHLLFR